jgi:signal transduction histidine kinase
MWRGVHEALHNVAKHSRATIVSVEMVANGREVALAICDDGVGFDVNQVRGTRGLGLVSMRERMHLIGGQFHIKASPGGGTRIQARAPLAND